MATKVCSRKECLLAGVQQPIDSFYRSSKGTPKPECKTCTKARVKKWADDNKERNRKYHTEYVRKRKVNDIEFVLSLREAGRKHDRKPHRKEYHKKEQEKRLNDPVYLLRRREEGRECLRRSRNTLAGKQRERDKYQRDKVAGKRKAHQAVFWAVKFGLLTKTSQCSTPNAGGRFCWGKTTFHHYKGYAEKNWLDVTELCERHHRLADNERRDRERNLNNTPQFVETSLIPDKE